MKSVKKNLILIGLRLWYIITRNNWVLKFLQLLQIIIDKSITFLIFWKTNHTWYNLSLYLFLTSFFGRNPTLNLLAQGPRRDSGSTGAKKVLDALENDIKANFQENIPGKVRFQKKSEGAAWLPLPPFVESSVQKFFL